MIFPMDTRNLYPKELFRSQIFLFLKNVYFGFIIPPVTINQRSCFAYGCLILFIWEIMKIYLGVSSSKIILFIIYKKKCTKKYFSSSLFLNPNQALSHNGTKNKLNNLCIKFALTPPLRKRKKIIKFNIYLYWKSSSSLKDL